MNTGDIYNDKAIRAAAQRFENNLSKYPYEEQIAVGAVMRNLLNGCSWEFSAPNPEIKRNLELFKNSKTCSVQSVTMSVDPIKKGYLIYMKMDYLISLLAKEAPGLVSKKDLERASNHRQSAVVGLNVLLRKGFKGTVGIFCTNDTQSVTIDGERMNAFAVSFREAMQVCERCNYSLILNYNGRVIALSPAEAMKKENAILDKLEVAPSKNALLINLAPSK